MIAFHKSNLYHALGINLISEGRWNALESNP